MPTTAALRRTCAAVVAVALVASSNLAATPTSVRAASTLTYPNSGAPGDCPVGALQQCVDAAAAGDTILIRQGSYTESIVLNNKPLTILGLDAGATLNAPANQRVIFADGATSDITLTLSNLTIRGGNVTGFGGGLYLGQQFNGSFTNITITQNSATSNGGGLHAASSVTLNNVRVISNTSQFASGGGISTSGAMTVTQSVVRGNTSGSHGGGLFSNAPSAIRATDSTFEDNHSLGRDGGGIYAFYSELLRTTVRNNTANVGGGVRSLYAFSSTDALFEDNGATLFGGGVASDLDAMLDRTTLRGNSSGSAGCDACAGGGYFGRTGRIRIHRSTFANNHSSGSGGGAEFRATNDVTVERSQIFDNVANSGAGLNLSGSHVRFDNNIIARNVVTQPLDGELALGPGANAVSSSSLTGHFNTFASRQAGAGTGLFVHNAPTHTVILTNSLFHDYATAVLIASSVEFTGHVTLNGVLWSNVQSPTTGALITTTSSVIGPALFVDPGNLNYHVVVTSAAVNNALPTGVTIDIDGDMRPNGAATDFGADESFNSPLALAGVDQSVIVNRLVQLNGSGSIDPDGNVPLTYGWRQLGGPATALSSASAVSPTFTAPTVPTPYTLTFGLIVTDTTGMVSGEDTVSIFVVNNAPIVDAGPDQTVIINRPVTLTATAIEPDGHAIAAYRWTQTGGVPVALANATSPTLTFASPISVGVLSFQFVVTDQFGVASAPDSVVVTVINNAPVVNAGADQSIKVGRPVTLTGAATDPDGHAMTYQWQQTGGPFVSFAGANTLTATFTAPSASVLTFTLIAVDQYGLASTPDSVVITVTNLRPIADAGPDQVITIGTVLTLNGSSSYDPDGDVPLTFEWSHLTGASPTMSNPNSATLTATLPVLPTPFTVAFGLVVTDTLSARSVVDSILITVTNAAPIANAGPDQIVVPRQQVALFGSVADPDGHALTPQWAQIGGLPVTLSSASAPAISFTAPFTPTVLTFTLRGIDQYGLAGATDTVVVTVTNRPPIADAGQDRTWAGFDTVSLIGNASDPDAHAITHRWRQIGGPAVTLASPNNLTTTFTAPPGPAVLTFTLTVTDQFGLVGAPDIVVHRIGNSAPQISTIANLTVRSSTPVTLTGSAVDRDGHAVTLRWAQIGGEPVSLTGASTPTSTFTSPFGPGVLTFTLTATDSLGLADVPATVVVTVINIPPEANAGPDQTVSSAAAVALNGSGSDPDGHAFSLRWAQDGGPIVAINNPSISATSFIAPCGPTVLTFTLTARDQFGMTGLPDAIVVTVTNGAPTVNAGPDQVAPSRKTVTLSGMASDPEGATTTVTWTQVSGPTVTLSNANSLTPTFTTPNGPATLRFELVATDACGVRSVSDSVEVSVTRGTSLNGFALYLPLTFMRR